MAALATVQQALARHTPALQRACVATCTAHITLGVMHLPDGEHIDGGASGQQQDRHLGSDIACQVTHYRCASGCNGIAPCCRGAAAGLLRCGGGAGCSCAGGAARALPAVPRWPEPLQPQGEQHVSVRSGAAQRVFLGYLQSRQLAKQPALCAPLLAHFWHAGAASSTTVDHLRRCCTWTW